MRGQLSLDVGELHRFSEKLSLGIFQAALAPEVRKSVGLDASRDRPGTSNRLWNRSDPVMG